jgi:hypothetical protein
VRRAPAAPALRPLRDDGAARRAVPGLRRRALPRLRRVGPGGCPRLPGVRAPPGGDLLAVRGGVAGGRGPLPSLRRAGRGAHLPALRPARGAGVGSVPRVRRDLVPDVRGAWPRGAPHGGDAMPMVRFRAGLRLPGLRDHPAERGIGMPGLWSGFPPALPVLRETSFRRPGALSIVWGHDPSVPSRGGPSGSLRPIGPRGPGGLSQLSDALLPIGGAVPVLRPVALPPVPCPALAG